MSADTGQLPPALAAALANEIDPGRGMADIRLGPRRDQSHTLFSMLGIQDARAVERLIRATFDPPK